jgi:intracellular multiplication protein IcmK
MTYSSFKLSRTTLSVAVALTCVALTSFAQTAPAQPPQNASSTAQPAAANANAQPKQVVAVQPIPTPGQVAQQRFGAEPITSTAPQFLPANQAPPSVPMAPPTVSAYGTPIYYNNQGQPQAQPVAAPNPVQQNTAQVPTSLPPLPQVSVPQAMQEGGLYLSPAQIREMHRQVDEMGRAAAEDTSGRPPRAETSSVKASLTPGSTPPVMRIYMNYPTSLVVVDSAGNPWPIENWAGGSSSIEVKRPLAKDSPESASLTITPRTPTGKFTHGGLTLYLKGLAIPVSLTYVGGQPVVDQRLEVRIPSRGPNTSAPVSVGVGPAANPSLLSLLDGVAPQGATTLKVTSGNAQAWSIGNNRMLIRTPLTVISPGYISGMRSADGTNVYEMEQVTELRAINGGQIVSVSIDY